MGPFRIAALICLWAVVAVTAQEKPQPPQQPTFRTGVNLVRVDAYPSRDGKIVEGLTADDFEVLEDGVPQKIESFQFMQFEQNAPLEERRDPNSQREAFELAADPSRRVFVLYLDNLHVGFTDSHRARVPLTTFMNRVLNPRDLFGVMTTVQRPEDLMLGSQSRFIEEQLAKYWDWGVGARVLEDDEDMMLQVCYPPNTPNASLVAEAIRRRRIDAVMEDLEGLTVMLAGIREERKNILLVSNGWLMSKPDPRLTTVYQPTKPQVGVTSPRGPGDTGVGRITLGARNANEVSLPWCEETLQRLLSMDFDARFREFLDLARRSNVTFYAMKGAGLEAPFADAVRRSGLADVNAELNAINARSDALLTLANNTDGLAIVNTNDLTGGARKIADDLAAAYILGYYPTNAKPDGRLRKITVRVKGISGTIRARREYRALTESEMATMRGPRDTPAPVTPAEDAFAELKRLRPAAVIHSRGSIVGDTLTLVTELTAPEIEAGRWKDGGDLQIVVTGDGAETVAMSKARIEPGARAASVQIPLNTAKGPFSATIRLRGTQGTADDSLPIARPSGALGAPLLFRLATPTQPRPAGSVFFRRTERMQVRWPVTGALTKPTARVLGRDGVPLELAVLASEKEEGGTRYVVVDVNLAPLTQGEYVLEVQAESPGATTSSRLAFRVFR